MRMWCLSPTQTHPHTFSLCFLIIWYYFGMSWIQVLPQQEQSVRHRLHPVTHNVVICLLWLGRDVFIKVLVVVPGSHSKLKGKCEHNGCGSEDKERKFSRTSEELGPESSFSLSFLLYHSLPLLYFIYISLHIFFCSSLHKLHSFHFHILGCPVAP